MAQGLPGLWYCMHLPNIFQQIGSATYSTITKFRGTALDHCFFYAPVQIFNRDYVPGWPERFLPTLAVCPDEIIDEVRHRSEELGFVLAATPYSELSDESLVRHWHAIHNALVPDVAYFDNEIKLTRRLDLAPISLPTRWLERQLGEDATESTDTEPRELVRSALIMHAAASACVRLDDQGLQEADATDALPGMIREELGRLSIPVTIAIPGIAAAYSRKVYSTETRSRIRSFSTQNVHDTWSTDIASRSDDMVERAAIELLTAHHATARTGIGLMLPSVPQQAFTAIGELERHFAGNPRGQVVTRLLNRLDTACAGLWTQWPCVKTWRGIVTVLWRMMVLRGSLPAGGCRTGSRSVS
jgi:hypothetical protein